MDNNNYITKEFYDSNMREFKEAVREMIAAADARTDKAVAEMKAEAAEMRAQYKITQIRLENIERSIEKFITRTSLILAGMTLLFTALQITFAIIALKK